jgi:hypothetical protein
MYCQQLVNFAKVMLAAAALVGKNRATPLEIHFVFSNISQYFQSP